MGAKPSTKAEQPELSQALPIASATLDAASLDDRAFAALVLAEVDGVASDAERAVLEADRRRWEWHVEDLLDDVEDGLDAVRERLTGPERAQVVADFEAERLDLVRALRRARGMAEDADDGLDQYGDGAQGGQRQGEDAPVEDGVARLQLSWSAGRLVAWAAGPGADPLDRPALSTFLDEVGAGGPAWAPHASVQIPGGPNASGLAVPVGDILGWLAAVQDRAADERLAASVQWFAAVSVWAVELVAKGSMVPLLKQKRKRRGSGDKNRLVHVRWTPALVDANRDGADVICNVSRTW